MPVFAGTVALLGGGAASILKGAFKISERFKNQASNAIEIDTENQKLVKSYIKDVLPQRNRELEIEREKQEAAFKKPAGA